MQQTEQLSQILAELGIASDYAQTHGLPVFEEAETRVSAGPNIIGREQELEPVTAGKWVAMRQAAQAEGVELLLVSGYRSYAYQASLIRRKIDAGQGLDEILSVTAP
ncbi:MAG: D-alanyl-D-alanine carboxypeptidase family protein, partial [Pseudomonadota bacterium]